ncbi:hypothetical protein V2J09_024157 [Rumex salicifolius]
MGRSPCCDKVGLKKGPWTPEEDQKLLAYVDEHGHGNWRALPTKAGLQRCGKSCRLRWTNYLRPDIIRGKFSLQEEQTIIQLHALLGNRWSAIATHLPKRTDNEIKNYWNTHLKKRLAKMGIDPITHKPKNAALVSTEGGGAHFKSAANLSHMAQWESARLEAEARLARQSNLKTNNVNLQEYVNNNNNPSQTSSSSNNLGVSNSSSSPPPHATRCLDVLRAWHNGTHYSPTSTLSFSENGPTVVVDPAVVTATATATAMIEFMGNNNSSNLIKEDGRNIIEQDHDHQFHDGDGISLMPTFTSIQPHQGSFIEGFTELLLCNFSEKNLSPDGGDGGSDGGGSGSGTEDNKSYWNSILNLVNSSPSSSQMF